MIFSFSFIVHVYVGPGSKCQNTIEVAFALFPFLLLVETNHVHRTLKGELQWLNRLVGTQTSWTSMKRDRGPCVLFYSGLNVNGAIWRRQDTRSRGRRIDFLRSQNRKKQPHHG